MLCQRCHVATRHPATIYDNNAVTVNKSNRMFGRSCMNCHSNIHGSNHPSGSSTCGDRRPHAPCDLSAVGSCWAGPRRPLRPRRAATRSRRPRSRPQPRAARCHAGGCARGVRRGYWQPLRPGLERSCFSAAGGPASPATRLASSATRTCEAACSSTAFRFARETDQLVRAVRRRQRRLSRPALCRHATSGSVWSTITGLWDQIPQFYSIDTKTPYAPIGGTPIGVDDATQRAIQLGAGQHDARTFRRPCSSTCASGVTSAPSPRTSPRRGRST